MQFKPEEVCHEDWILVSTMGNECQDEMLHVHEIHHVSGGIMFVGHLMFRGDFVDVLFPVDVAVDVIM